MGPLSFLLFCPQPGNFLYANWSALVCFSSSCLCHCIHRLASMITRKPTKSYPFPKKMVIFAFALMLGFSPTFAVILGFPVGWSIPRLNFQLGFFAQYVVLFIVGLVVFCSNWLMTRPKETGRFSVQNSTIAVSSFNRYFGFGIPAWSGNKCIFGGL